MFCARAITIAPGDVRLYEATEWRDAIVSVERGELELECMSGTCQRFERGSLVWLCDHFVHGDAVDAHDRGRQIDQTLSVGPFGRWLERAIEIQCP
jgi:hypothetical protein